MTRSLELPRHSAGARGTLIAVADEPASAPIMEATDDLHAGWTAVPEDLRDLIERAWPRICDDTALFVRGGTPRSTYGAFILAADHPAIRSMSKDPRPGIRWLPGGAHLGIGPRDLLRSVATLLDPRLGGHVALPPPADHCWVLVATAAQALVVPVRWTSGPTGRVERWLRVFWPRGWCGGADAPVEVPRAGAADRVPAARTVATEQDDDGLVLGLLDDGSGYVNGASLARCCGVAPATLLDLAASWAAGNRSGALAAMLVAARVRSAALVVEVVKGGRRVDVFPGPIAGVILRYFASATVPRSPVAARNARRVPRRFAGGPLRGGAAAEPRLTRTEVVGSAAAARWQLAWHNAEGGPGVVVASATSRRVLADELAAGAATWPVDPAPGDLLQVLDHGVPTRACLGWTASGQAAALHAATGRWTYDEACRAWVRGRSWPDAWEACRDARWMLLAVGACVNRILLVRAACACARTALWLIPPSEERPARAVGVAEAWTRGEVSLDAVRAATAAAGAARDAFSPFGSARASRVNLAAFVATAAAGVATAPADGAPYDAAITAARAADCLADVTAGGAEDQWGVVHAALLAEMADRVREAIPLRAVVPGLVDRTRPRSPGTPG